MYQARLGERIPAGIYPRLDGAVGSAFQSMLGASFARENRVLDDLAEGRPGMMLYDDRVTAWPLDEVVRRARRIDNPALAGVVVEKYKFIVGTARDVELRMGREIALGG